MDRFEERRRAGFTGWRDSSGDRPLPPEDCPKTLFHVSPAANRNSIREHGLDWTRMGAAPGLASGRHLPEEPLVYLDEERGFSLWFRNHGQLMDVWEVRADGLDLVRTGDGWIGSPKPIGPERLALLEKDLDPQDQTDVPEDDEPTTSPGSGGFIEWER
jgi:hypothetical protein